MTCPRCSAPPYLEAVADPATGLPIGETKLNLKAAIAGETHEYTDMYPGMAKSAREEDFGEIADWFETLAKAERSHANRFQKALVHFLRFELNASMIASLRSGATLAAGIDHPNYRHTVSEVPGAVRLALADDFQ